MRARHRHFNPKAAGATFGWDTRYNSDGHTNNGAVGTWTDRFSNTATQTATTPTDRRPKWKDNATDNINGFPVVQFDGIDDWLETASITSQTAIFAMAVFARNWATGSGTPYKSFFQTQSYASTAGIALLTYSGGAAAEWVNQCFIANANGFTIGRAPRASSTSLSGFADGSPRIATTELTSSTADIWVDGVSKKNNGTTGSVPSTTSVLRIGGNTAANDRGDYRVAVAIYYKDTSPSSSVRKRLEHAAAFSFKISCN